MLITNWNTDNTDNTDFFLTNIQMTKYNSSVKNFPKVDFAKTKVLIISSILIHDKRSASSENQCIMKNTTELLK